MLTSLIDKVADKVRWGYLTAFSLLLISYILTFYSSQQVLTQQRWVDHTTRVIGSLDQLQSNLKEAESALRGYLLSRDERFLSEYKRSQAQLDTNFMNLRQLTEDNPIQQERLDTLRNFIDQKIDIMDNGMRLYLSGTIPRDSMTLMGNRSRLTMDTIRLLTVKLQTEESRLMEDRSKKVSTLSNFIKVINVASIVIAIVLAFYSITKFNKENRAKREADRMAEKFREQLELRIDELKKVNSELMELRGIEKFAVTGRIARTIAHEVRNPLTNINLATEHLRSELPLPPETTVLVDMISRNSNRINDLINDLLNSTKVAQLDFTKVNLNEVIDQSLSFAQDRIDLKGIRIEKKYAPDLPLVMGDVEKLKIVFLNIIVNAVEAIQTASGVISITTAKKDDRCTVTICDNGRGMSQESLSKLFEPYFTTKEKGTGLGLTHTQNIIFSHQAKIHAESQEGKGSCFIISFQCA